ncbi:MAG: ribonuclease Z [Blastocatellia bacterium]
MRIIPFGTSSGRPTLQRHVSSLAVVGEGEWWLFDCGEAAQIQLMRAGLSAHKLEAIFITHLHGDHFNGLPGLLSTMSLDQRQRPLLLVGPPGIVEYLALLRRLKSCYVGYPLTVREYGARDFTERGGLTVYDEERYVVTAQPLDHRIFAIGYRLTEKDRPGRFDVERARELGIPAGPLYAKLQAGEAITLADGRRIESAEVVGPPRPGPSLAYCLDTRPCVNAVTLSHGADCLIHEATFTDEHRDEADQYGHSTASQAAEVARLAKVKRLVITHFSSRYPDYRPLLAEARRGFPETVAAEDLVELSL